MYAQGSSATLEMWGDVRCPWCWIGFRRLYAAAAASGSDAPIRHRSFLLEPNGPAGERTEIREAAVTSWGMTEAEWAERSREIRRTGAEVGVQINVDTARQIDSRDAHRLLKLAVERGVDPRAAWDRVFDAHLRANDDLEDMAVLVGLGERFGLDAESVREALATGAYAAEVESDHREAVTRGVRSVPTVFRGRRKVAGAAGADEFMALMQPSGEHR